MGEKVFFFFFERRSFDLINLYWNLLYFSMCTGHLSKILSQQRNIQWWSLAWKSEKAGKLILTFLDTYHTLPSRIIALPYHPYYCSMEDLSFPPPTISSTGYGKTGQDSISSSWIESLTLFCTALGIIACWNGKGPSYSTHSFLQFRKWRHRAIGWLFEVIQLGAST